MKGTFFIVSRCGVSASAKKYWDLKSHGPGGQKSCVSKQTNAGKWQDRAIKWLDGRTRKCPALKCASLARACKKACVDIPIGTVVEGSMELTDPSKLVVLIEKAPPPFEAPLEDFELKAIDRRQ